MASVPLPVPAVALRPERTSSIGRTRVPEILLQGGHGDIRSRVTENRDLCVTVGRREHGYFSIFFENSFVFDYHIHGHEGPQSILSLVTPAVRWRKWVLLCWTHSRRSLNRRFAVEM